MKLYTDSFELFGVQRRFVQDAGLLDARWRALQSEVHPDRFASEGAAARRIAMQWAIRVNEAYAALKDPLRRAAHLCELHGVQINAENNNSMPSAFLMQQMEWRESLRNATSVEQVQLLASEVAAEREKCLASLKSSLDDEQDFDAASTQVLSLMFVERFVRDVEQRLESLGY